MDCRICVYNPPKHKQNMFSMIQHEQKRTEPCFRPSINTTLEHYFLQAGNLVIMIPLFPRLYYNPISEHPLSKSRVRTVSLLEQIAYDTMQDSTATSYSIKPYAKRHHCSSTHHQISQSEIPLPSIAPHSQPTLLYSCFIIQSPSGRYYFPNTDEKVTVAHRPS